MKRTILSALLIVSVVCFSLAKTRVFVASDYGLKPGTGGNASPLVEKLLAAVKQTASPSDKVVIRLDSGRYDFHETGSATRTYYISNHDQDNPKWVGFALEDFNNLTLEGRGAQLVFHGRMLPISLLRSKNCELKDLSIDFETPHITQITVVENSPAEGITFRVAPWVNYRLTADSVFEVYGEGWTVQPSMGIAFDGKTRHVVYNTSDVNAKLNGVYAVGDRLVRAPKWKDSRLTVGTVFALRSWGRPTPGLFFYLDKDTKLTNVKVHYCEGMGLLAQLCENITMEGFGVCLKGDNDPRYFTSQADATHFSGCKGRIISRNGLYEGMMDDAINVHGTYLKVLERKDDYTLRARYMHDQSWGFAWGYAGDKVQFIRSKTMELIGEENNIVSIKPFDKPTVDGAREFLITFKRPLDAQISGKEGFGIENLTWTPEVVFSGNMIRNNRARGSLFSTPKRTVVENNIFDHTSGCAILLCGDCNGWYETGACRNVIIQHNKFINALTNQFQFTNAIISIYPEIPDLAHQTKYFHGGHKGAIRIENNEFDTFDNPILYAKSVDGLVFRNNVIRKNTEYKPFHWNKKPCWLERVVNAEIEGL